ncbi:MAG: FtsX-like permease family protein [Candidatus Cloacimonadota bacterium]|nr:FtsX-like permease family protein [Candidatus Cloacimonadota bacterium]
MFKFLTKGLLRDRTRSFFPILIISAGVMLTVVVYSWLMGYLTMTIQENARFDTGHVKIITRAYHEMIDQKPFDLGIIGIKEMEAELQKEYPEMTWLPRIYFGGLLDLPDEKGETKEQGEVMGMAVDLFSNSKELELLNLDKAIYTGKLPQKSGEILISYELTEKLGIKLNDKVTIISSTMYGSMAMQNFTVSGTVIFGIMGMDRGAVITDISDAQLLLDMENAASEILGFLPLYNQEQTMIIADNFNKKFMDEKDEFSPVMLPLISQNNLEIMLSMINERSGMFIFIFVFLMSLVLWNSGLMNGIRRYGEIGVRLAIGESKGHIYRSMILESLFVGIAGTVIGTATGLIFSYILQYIGIDISSLMKDTKMIMSTTMKAQVTPVSYYIGFLPGVLSSVIGAMIPGIGIYKRNTAQLFKELET